MEDIAVEQIEERHQQVVEQGCRWLRIGAVLAGLSVITGAFAAHRLGKPLEELYQHETRRIVGGTEIPAAQKYLQDFKTAAEYQMYHALGLLVLGTCFPRLNQRAANVAGNCFLWGTVLFSGSLYTLVLTGLTKLGAITPIGGVLFIVGWAAFAWAASGRMRSQ